MEWIAKIDKILYDGIIIKEAVKKHPFEELITNKEFGKIRDIKAFENHNFNEGQLVKIKIRYIGKKEPYIINTKKMVKWNSIVYEIVGNAIYTKQVVMGEDRYSSIFNFQRRSYIMDDIYLNDSLDANNMPFEIGDCIEVEIGIIR